MIEDAKKRGLAPTEVLADFLYDSEKNDTAATATEAEVVAPVPGGEKKSKSSSLSEFALTEEGGIAGCPIGHAPIENVAYGNHRKVVFSVGHCLGCPRRSATEPPFFLLVNLPKIQPRPLYGATSPILGLVNSPKLLFGAGQRTYLPLPALPHR